MVDTMSFVCVACPRGCLLEVARAGEGAVSVRGNACAKGSDYGSREATDPRRTLTTTVATAFPLRPRLPVRSSGEIPKARLVEAARSLDSLVVRARTRRGEAVLRNLLGLGVDVVATDDLD
jgi:CxxC motif-containing protein